MRYRKLKTLLILMLISILLMVSVSCKKAQDEVESGILVTSTEQFVEESGDGSAVAQLNKEDPYADLHEQYKGDPEGLVIAMYAQKNGIDIEEAEHRFEIMNNPDTGSLNAELEAAGMKNFGGFWIQHEPDFCLVAAFTENGEESIAPYREKYPGLAEFIVVRQVKYSYQELLSAQEEAIQILNELDLFFSSGTMIMDNRVEIYITDSQLFNSRLEESGKNLPECVVPVITYEPKEGVPEGINPEPSVHFPQFATASNEYMTALLTGTLELVDGYLRVYDSLIIWQPDFYVHNNNGTIEIWDRDGKVVGRVGEEIYMGGGSGGNLGNINPRLSEPLPEDIEGPFWIQGGGTRLNLNFNSEYFNLHVITDEENKAYYLTGKPALDEMARQEITLTGKWTASYPLGMIPYPQFVTEPKPMEHKGSVSYTTFWPAGYTARITDGIFEVLDEQGKVVVRDGEEICITGKTMSGYVGELHDDLPGGYSGPYLIVEEIQ